MIYPGRNSQTYSRPEGDKHKADREPYRNLKEPVKRNQPGADAGGSGHEHDNGQRDARVSEGTSLNS